MKAKLIIFVSLFLVQTLISQNYQTVEEVNKACSQLGFSGDEDAEIAVDNILDQIGLFRNFIIQECPDINNALAKNIEISPGHKERYILYDANFFKRMDDKAGNDWAAMSILAHEIGHHLKGHALNDEGSNHKFEIEADNWSGWVLAKMGATLEEAQSAIQTLKYEKATRTHPAKVDRLAAIEKGWNKGKGLTITITVEEENEDEAIEFYKKGEIAYQNFNYSESISHFEKAKELGYVDAYYYLSNFYYLGQGTKIDYAKAFGLAEEGYEKGSIPTTYQLGKYYAKGYGVAKNKELASRLFQKDFQIKWFEDQFDKTNSGFHAYTIGYMYSHGYGGVKEDLKKTIFWYKKADALGDPISQINLAHMYQGGKGVEKDSYEAVKFSRKAAEQGLAQGQYGLGWMYLNGAGVEKDYYEAIKWYRKAAEQGHAHAQAHLGMMYQGGKGVEKDDYEAVKWYRKAAEQGLAMGQNMLGMTYAEGNGVEKDYNEAVKWFRMAAEQGDAMAQKDLGAMYYNGFGVTKNKDKAIYWLKKSAKQGDRNAQGFLTQMGESW